MSQTKIFEYMENQQPIILLGDHKIQILEKGVVKIVNKVGTAGLGQLLLEQEYDLNGWYLYLFEDNTITINHYTRSLFLEKLRENLFVDSLTKEAVPEAFLKYLPLWCKICKYCGRTEKDIRNEKKKTGKKSFCFERNTEKGFHKFILKELIEK